MGVAATQGVAATPGMASVGQGLQEPKGKNLEGAGEGTHLAAASETAHSGPGVRNGVRSDPGAIKGAKSPATSL